MCLIHWIIVVQIASGKMDTLTTFAVQLASAY
jgi:hypothetical protein